MEIILDYQGRGMEGGAVAAVSAEVLGEGSGINFTLSLKMRGF